MRDIPVVGFRNGKSLNDHFVGAKLPNIAITGRFELCGKGNPLVCDFVCDADTFSTKTCSETFKIQSGIFNCNSQKVVYLLKSRNVVKLLMLAMQERNLEPDLVIFNVLTDPMEKKPVKYHSSIFMNIMANTVIIGLISGSSH